MKKNLMYLAVAIIIITVLVQELDYFRFLVVGFLAFLPILAGTVIYLIDLIKKQTIQ